MSEEAERQRNEFNSLNTVGGEIPIPTDLHIEHIEGDFNKDVKNVINQYIQNQFIQAQPRTPAFNPLEDRPREVPHFTGRDAELEIILRDLQPSIVFTLCGPGGIGKSALATEVLWRLAPNDSPPTKFPDGIIWYTFSSRPQTDTALDYIVKKFGEEPLPSLFEAAKRALAGKKLLLVLDGVEKAETSWTKVLKVTGMCGVLVTSQRHTDGVEGKLLDIRPLALEYAEQLLQDWGQEYAADRIAVRGICERVGRLPLAVQLVGGYLRSKQRTAAEYLEWLKEKSPLEILNQEELGRKSVPLIIERSLQDLSQDARQVLNITGVLAYAPFLQETIAAIIDIPQDNMRKALDELVNYSLLIRSAGRRRYEVSHALIRDYVNEHIEVDDITVEKLAVYYVNICRKVEEENQRIKDYNSLNEEREHFLHILLQCKKRQEWEAVLALSKATGQYFFARGYLMNLRTTAVLGLKAARKLGKRLEEALCIKNLGRAYSRLAEYKKARSYYEKARCIYSQLKDSLGEADCLKSLGQMYLDLKEYEKARCRYEEAHTIYSQFKKRLGEADCLVGIGHVHLSRTEYEKALTCFKNALSIYSQFKDPLGEADCLKSLGQTGIELKAYEGARTCFRDALVIYCELGILHEKVTCIKLLGDVNLKLEDYDLARAYFENLHSYFIFFAPSENLWRNRLEEADCIQSLGYVDYKQGKYEDARNRFNEAFSIYTDLENREKEAAAACLLALGEVDYKLDDYDEAWSHYKKAQSIYVRIGDRLGEADCIRSLGQIFLAQDAWPQAKELFQQALQIYQDLPSPFDIAISHILLGGIQVTQGNQPEAKHHYQAALEQFTQLGLTNDVQRIQETIDQLWFSIGNVFFDQKNFAEAIAAYQKQIEMTPDHADAWYNLGVALIDQYTEEEAVTLYQQQIERTLTHDWAWGILGNIFFNQEHFEQAAEFYQRQVEVTPTHETAWISLGIALDQQEKYLEAIEALRKQVDVKKDHETAWHVLGELLEANNAIPEAVEAYQRQIEVLPKHGEAWFSLADVLTRHYPFETMLPRYQQLIDHTAAHAWAWDLLGLALEQQGHIEQALEAYYQQVSIEPEHLDAWAHLGDAYISLGMVKEAIVAYQQQVTVNPDHETAWKHLAMAFEQQGDLDDVIAAYQKQIEITPDTADAAYAWIDMGVAFWKQDQWEQATDAWEQAQKIYADILEEEPDDLTILAHDAELALVQDDLSGLQTRIESVRPLISPDDELFVLRPFFAWLARPEQGWEPVMTAIEEAEPELSFDWNFFSTTPAIERQDEETQQIARHFIAFFEGKIDLPTLKARLEISPEQDG